MHGQVGLDIGSDQVSVCVLAATGEELTGRWDIPNTQPGAQDVLARLETLAQSHEIDRWQIGMEATNLYWWPLACLLSTATSPVPLEVYVLNPKLVKDFRDTLGHLPKTDRQDALVIAERIRFGRGLPRPFAVDWRYAPLQRLTRLRIHLAQALAREKAYFLTMLFLPWSGFVQSHALGDPFGPTGCALLEELTCEEVAQQGVEELAAFLQQHGRGHFADPRVTATALRRSAADSYRLSDAMREPMRLVLGTTRATIRCIEQQLVTVDQTIAKELAGITQTLTSIPGIGPVWSAALIGEIGEITRFPDHASLAQYAGLTWSVHESGHFQAEDTAMTKRGNTYLRYALIEAANSVRVHCPEYQAYYHAKYADTPKHAHKRALVLTARKLVRLVDALLRTTALYQSPEHRKSRKEHTRPHNRRPARHTHTRPVSAVS